MPPPTLLSRGEGANDSRPGNEGSTKLPSRGSDTPIEELRSCSFENSRNASAHDERVAFISPSISSISDDQTLNAAPGLTASEQHHNHEAARFSEGETPSLKRERTAPPYSDKSPESVWTVWWMEIFSSFLALGCIIAMVVILSIYQGQPLPRWPKLISINSLIAVFTAIFKASLILPVAEGKCSPVAELPSHLTQRIQTHSDKIYNFRSRTAEMELVRSIPEAGRPCHL